MKSTAEGSRLGGLYVILDPIVCPERSLSDVLKASLEGGVRIFQYRNKQASMKDAYIEALVLRRIASDQGAVFIVNDRCDLALAVDADGVHLGQGDMPYDLARSVMGSNKIIGLSTHNSHQVEEAERMRPDYIGFGPIFKPGSKQDHDPLVGLDGLRTIRSLTTLPVFAIGGIVLDRVDEVIRAGADGVAVISAVLSSSDIRQAVGEFLTRMPRRSWRES